MLKTLTFLAVSMLFSGQVMAQETFAHSAEEVTAAMAYKPLRQISGNKALTAIAVVGDQVQFIVDSCRYVVDVERVDPVVSWKNIEYRVTQISGPVCASQK